MATMIHGKLKRQEIYRQTWNLKAAGETRVNNITPDLFPEGIIHGMTVILESEACTALADAATDFHKVARAFTYGSKFPNHNVMTAFPGLKWHNIFSTLNRRALKSRTPAAATGFKAEWYLPWAWSGTAKRPAHRPKDTSLMNLKGKALPFLNLLLGSFLDLGTDVTACAVEVVVIVHYEPAPQPGGDNPVNPLDGGDEPNRMLVIAELPKADLSKKPIFALTTGGARENIGLVFIEEDTDGEEVDDIFDVGLDKPSSIEIIKGEADSWTPQIKVKDLDDLMDAELEAAIPAGYHFWLAAAEGRLRDTVPLNDGGKFRAMFDNIDTVQDRVLKCVQIDALGIPEAVVAGWQSLYGEAK
jgi:hypothetical protein